MFGSAPAPAGLFGSTPSSAPLFGAFGTQQQQQQQASPFSGGLFGTQQPQQQQQQPQQQHQYLASSNPHQAALHAHQSASQRQEVARLEEAIYNIHSRYSSHAPDPTNPTITSNHIPSSTCAFTAILYDELPCEYKYQGQCAVPRPNHISHTTWTEALARNPNPNTLVPVAIVGATALHSRIVHQQERANTLANHASKLANTIDYLQESANTSSTEIMIHITSNQESLQRRLLHIMRKVEILRCMGQPTQRAELDAYQRLGEIMKQVRYYFL
jgi:nuclear pore complex protein Nup54